MGMHKVEMHCIHVRNSQRIHKILYFFKKRLDTNFGLVTYWFFDVSVADKQYITSSKLTNMCFFKHFKSVVTSLTENTESLMFNANVSNIEWY